MVTCPNLTLNLTVLVLPLNSEAAERMSTERSPSGRDASERSRPAPANSREYAQSVSDPAPIPIARAAYGIGVPAIWRSREPRAS